MRCKPLQEAAVLDRVLGAIRVNGNYCPITNLFGIFGEDVDTIGEAAVALGQLPDGSFFTTPIDETSFIRLN